MRVPRAGWFAARLVGAIVVAMLCACGSTKPSATPPPAVIPDAGGPDATVAMIDASIPLDAPAVAVLPDAAAPAPPAKSPPVKPPPPKRPPVAKPDIADYAKPGEAPDLIPVRGKLTIFEFGAAWCTPCKTLEPALATLAKQHPTVVAIRKLDVVDLDSKASERYLTPGGFDLPHLEIFDAAGKRVLSQSSAPGQLDALIARVRALVEAAAQRR